MCDPTPVIITARHLRAGDSTIPTQTMTLAGWLQSEADRVRAINTAAADLVAEKIEEMVIFCRVNGCECPSQYREREEELQRMYRGER